MRTKKFYVSQHNVIHVSDDPEKMSCGVKLVQPECWDRAIKVTYTEFGSPYWIHCERQNTPPKSWRKAAHLSLCRRCKKYVEKGSVVSEYLHTGNIGV